VSSDTVKQLEIYSILIIHVVIVVFVVFFSLIGKAGPPGCALSPLA
jgi:hypothetical protein